MKETIFTFELMNRYPNQRRFIIKKPLSTSIFDLSELFGRKK